MPMPRRRRVDVPTLAVALALLLATALGQVPEPPARQVTVFGVIASPSDPRTDPRLSRIEPQLRKLFPDHGFRLLDVQSKRLVAGQTVTCNLEDGLSAATTLLQPIDADGKVRLRCAVLLNQAVQLETLVSTPPNQLFFCDKSLDGGARLLIGVGAR